MNLTRRNPARVLQLRRTYPASREKVFAAWTQPEILKKWWGVAEGYTVPIAEVDLRVGGTYRLGMLPPTGDRVFVLSGAYQVIEPPEKLVFAWGLESPQGREESLITLQFLRHGDQTEMILTHQYRGGEEKEVEFRAGWEGMFARLEKALAQVNVGCN